MTLSICFPPLSLKSSFLIMTDSSWWLISTEHWQNFFWDKTSDAFFFVSCLLCTLILYLMGGRPYGCLYHDLYNDDYTEICVITFAKTITLDRYHNVRSENGVGNKRQRVIKTDSYISSRLIDHFFYDSFYRLKSLVLWWFLLKQLNWTLHQDLCACGCRYLCVCVCVM